MFGGMRRRYRAKDALKDRERVCCSFSGSCSGVCSFKCQRYRFALKYLLVQSPLHGLKFEDDQGHDMRARSLGWNAH